MRMFDREETGYVQEAIEKWQGIARGTVSDYGDKNCRLCLEYEECIECPIAIFNGHSSCMESPYIHWQDHHTLNHNWTGYVTNPELSNLCPTCTEIALREVAFLKLVKRRTILLRRLSL